MATKKTTKTTKIKATIDTGIEIKEIVNEAGEGKTVNLDPTQIYDFRELILDARCPSCRGKLHFSKVKPKESLDIVSMAVCCGMQYSMAIEKVRILSVPVAVLSPTARQLVDNSTDDEFLKELAEFTAQKERG